MHGPCQKPLSERARTALSLIMMSWAAFDASSSGVERGGGV